MSDVDRNGAYDVLNHLSSACSSRVCKTQDGQVFATHIAFVVPHLLCPLTSQAVRTHIAAVVTPLAHLASRTLGVVRRDAQLRSTACRLLGRLLPGSTIEFC